MGWFNSDKVMWIYEINTVGDDVGRLFFFSVDQLSRRTKEKGERVRGRGVWRGRGGR